MAWTLTVEVGFATQPMATTPTWTDITAFVLAKDGITRTWGRTDEFGEVQPSTLSLTLNNTDGRFTRGLTSSPYYPNVRNGKRIRVTGKRSGASVLVNLLRKAESDFEDGTVGNWVIGSGATSFVSAAELPDEGSRSGKLTADGTAIPFLHNGGSGSDSAVSGNVGDSFTVGIRLRSASATRNWRAVLRWLTTTDAYHSQTDGTFTSCGSGSYTQLSVSGTMPSGAAKVLAQWESQTTPAAGEVWHADKAQLTKTATLQTWEAGPTFYRRFDGHVNEWPTEWTSGRATYAEARITATDRFKRFSDLGELRSMLEEEILRDNAIAYYPLGDPSGSRTAGNISKQVQPAAVLRQKGSGGEINFGNGTGPGTDELPAPSFEPVDADNGLYLEASPLGTQIGGNPGYTLECFFDCLAIGSRMLCALTNASGIHALLQLDSTGKLQAEQTIPFLPDEVTTSAVETDDGKTHHGALTVSISGTTATMRLYLDGAEVGTAQTWTVPGGNLSTYSRLIVGGNTTGDCFRGTLSHVAAHSTALSAARILEHYNAGHSGLAGERTDQRIGRVADWVGIPTADRNFDVGDSTVSAQATSGQQPLSVMREVEKAEAGVLFISGDNKLTFHNRSRRYNVTPAVTLTGLQILGDLVFPGDDFGMTNDMTVTRSSDSGARAIDQASIDEYGLYRDTLQIPAVNDGAMLAIAQWRVGNYGTPRTRVPNVTVELAKLEQIAPSQVALLLVADISTKLRLSSLPTQAPTSTVDLFVEGGTETVTSRFWRIIFNTSPGDYSQVWQLGVSGFSELGDTTRLGL